MRFASHRDVARAIERGVRKAGLPVAYSAGFSPHPKISYSGGAPTGAASEAEYLDMSLTRRCEPADVGRRLDAALPDGIDVIDVAEADGKSAAQLEASAWEVTWPGVTAAATAAAAAEFLAAGTVEVSRLTPKGVRRLDARAAVISVDVLSADGRRADPDQAGGPAILRMVVRQVTPAVRPDDVLAALGQSSALATAAPLPAPAAPPPLVARLWQGPLSDLTRNRDFLTTAHIRPCA
jgi:radical SAM-linked protein